jgi:sulfite exporter TauE/SafE
MQAELTLSLAFLAGLAGAGHCWAMCGGLVGGLFLRCAGCAPEAHGWRRLFPHVAYHAGRVLAYTLIGGLAAALGQAIVLTGGVGRVQGVFYIVAGLLVVVAGILAMRQPVGCQVQQGGCLSQRGDKVFYPLAGFFNGLMPCALVFSLAIKAATAPSIVTGAMWLFVFGLGTLPAMAFAAALAHGIGVQALLTLRRIAGLLVIMLGAQAMWAGAKFFNVMLHL